MSLETDRSNETERQRLQRMRELTAELGTDWEKQFAPGSFGCHELLDRTSLVLKMIEEFIANHPSCIGNAEWYALAEQAAEALGSLYQQVGSEH
jgi:hypothetical protein